VYNFVFSFFLYIAGRGPACFWTSALRPRMPNGPVQLAQGQDGNRDNYNLLMQSKSTVSQLLYFSVDSSHSS